MASSASIPLQLPPLDKQSMTRLIAEAKRVGLAPEVYAKQLVEDGLALRREAVSEIEVVNLVEKVRGLLRRNRQRTTK